MRVLTHTQRKRMPKADSAALVRENARSLHLVSQIFWYCTHKEWVCTDTGNKQTTRMAAAEQPQRHKYTGREKKTAPNTISQQKLHLDWTTRYEFWWCCVSFVSWTSSKNLWISPLQMTLHAFHSNFFSSYLFFFFSWNGFR